MQSRQPSSDEDGDTNPQPSKQPPSDPREYLPEDVAAGKPLAEVVPGWFKRTKRLLIGRPRDLADRSIVSHVSLVAFLAWVGLGADGLSSSCYGPPEAFATLGNHQYLSVFLALAIVGTVLIIATCYSHIIEEFPSGGGGYLVASKLLGPYAGVVSGCALVVDYVLTITVSIAVASHTLTGLMGPQWTPYRVHGAFAAIVLLIVLNLRGVKESVQVLLPVFVLFLVTHLILIVGAVGFNLSAVGRVAGEVRESVASGLADPKLGLFGMVGLLLYAYSMGAGTYTGLEAVSNSMPVMREPRVATGKRTMLYMAVSLAFTAAGLIVAYLLLGIRHDPGEHRTMNHVLTQAWLEEIGLAGGLGMIFLWATLISEGMLLIVGAQAGFIDGPRVLANMAHDSWMPRWFATLSERLTIRNGIVLMGAAALAALLYTGGNVTALVTMYAINVFVTFSLSMIGMARHWWQMRDQHPLWRRRFVLFVVGGALCIGILSANLWEKRAEGAAVTVGVTLVLVLIAFLVNRYYRKVGAKLMRLDDALKNFVTAGEPNRNPPDPDQPAAIVLVGGYSGIGIHTMLNAVRYVPNYFKSFVFISVGVIDSGNFKGGDAVEELRLHTKRSLDQYVELARSLGMPAEGFLAIGTDAVEELERLCCEVVQKYHHGMIFAGQLVFQQDTWLHRLLHNQTAYFLQRRLQWIGVPMIILPTRVR